MEEINQTPQVANLVHGLREIGYTIDTAIADLVDNSITANSENIDVVFLPEEKKPILAILDDGDGMAKSELIEAMRPATKNPTEFRKPNDLGRYGLGLKTASFSQSKKLTVLSKTKDNDVAIAEWDLDKLIERNEWVLNLLSKEELDFDLPIVQKFYSNTSGTLVVWNGIDKVENNEIAIHTPVITDHLSLVFNRFLSGYNGARKTNIRINNVAVKALDPVDKKNQYTCALESSTFKVNNKKIFVQPYILPSGLKTDTDTFKKNATHLGYKDAQGFYLYRANRLITWGTWWRLVKRHDNYNLTRIEVDIDNCQDSEWSVSVTKSGFSVKPPEGIRDDLRGIVRSSSKTGKGVIRGRGTVKPVNYVTYWNQTKNLDNGQIDFSINKEHPLYVELTGYFDSNQRKLFNLFIADLAKYLPKQDIYRNVMDFPSSTPVAPKSEANPEGEFTQDDIKTLIDKLREKGLKDEQIKKMFEAEGLSEYIGEYFE